MAGTPEIHWMKHNQPMKQKDCFLTVNSGSMRMPSLYRLAKGMRQTKVTAQVHIEYLISKEKYPTTRWVSTTACSNLYCLFYASRETLAPLSTESCAGFARWLPLSWNLSTLARKSTPSPTPAISSAATPRSSARKTSSSTVEVTSVPVASFEGI